MIDIEIDTVEDTQQAVRGLDLLAQRARAQRSPGRGTVHARAPRNPAAAALARRPAAHASRDLLAAAFCVLAVLASAPRSRAHESGAGGVSQRIVVVVGDSLSAEYGLPRNSGWVKLLADRVAKQAPEYSVVNASISGDTTSGGRARLPEVLGRLKPAIVVIELGANDGLRGLSTRAMEENLEAMDAASRAAGARVLLVGMRLPPNYGAPYTGRFAAVYARVAQRDGVALAPFLMDGFAQRLDWFQPDRLHPLPVAQARMLENVWPALRPLLGAPRAAH